MKHCVKPARCATFGALILGGPTYSVGSVDVTASSFEGNHPFAISNLAPTPANAADNWWGLPTGPVHVGVGAAAPPEAGPQYVTGPGPIVTAPHRVSP